MSDVPRPWNQPSLCARLTTGQLALFRTLAECQCCNRVAGACASEFVKQGDRIFLRIEESDIVRNIHMTGGGNSARQEFRLAPRRS